MPVRQSRDDGRRPFSRADTTRQGHGRLGSRVLRASAATLKGLQGRLDVLQRGSEDLIKGRDRSGGCLGSVGEQPFTEGKW